ncbi:UDP-glucose 4-epimerase GalE [Chryseolinea sp. H1M3-3]|uniref:UDP-glucose 4-epimerase GalE n=1 Tax=Chryseolinea sp. H1M3-3 TaxID=3034144 RepID=UPI0023EBE543|nr:UDP-glucose 4-epimerase GalE [Chryseolinea sp. H1M3-3]
MKAKKILVTGGAGYIGAHTAVELINAGYDVAIVDNLSRSDKRLLEGIEKITGKPVKFFEGDCRDRNFLLKVFQSEGPFSCVLHFAAYKAVGESVEKPLLYYENNLNSTIALVEIMIKCGVTDFIFSSSCTVYGQPDQIPVSEAAPFKKAESPYGATKQMSERILEDVSRNNIRIITLRYFNPIGAHPSALIGEIPLGTPNNLVPFITQTAVGVREKLTVFGNDYNTADGTCIRDYIHVVDLATAHVKAMEYLSQQRETKFYEVFNVGTGIGVSVLELINRFKAVNNVELNYEIGSRRSGDIEKVFADPSKAMSSLGWAAKFTIDDSLLHAWQWEKKIRDK